MMDDRYCKAKGIKIRGTFWENGLVIYISKYIFTNIFCQKPKLREEIWLFVGLWNWSEIAPWLSCCLHRLLTIVSLAADLVHQDCIISGRTAKVHSLSTKTVWSIWSLFSFWSSTPLPASPLHRITEADLFWIFFHWIVCLLDSCLPAASGSPGWCNFFL